VVICHDPERPWVRALTALAAGRKLGSVYCSDPSRSADRSRRIRPWRPDALLRSHPRVAGKRSSTGRAATRLPSSWLIVDEAWSDAFGKEFVRHLNERLPGAKRCNSEQDLQAELERVTTKVAGLEETNHRIGVLRDRQTRVPP